MSKSIADAGSLTMKPKIKRSYGKRKSISVPELLSVRVEMTSEDADKLKINQDKVLGDGALTKIESKLVHCVEYDVGVVQDINVHEDVQEIDWTEHTEQSQANVEVAKSALITVRSKQLNVFGSKLISDGN